MFDMGSPVRSRSARKNRIMPLNHFVSTKQKRPRANRHFTRTSSSRRRTDRSTVLQLIYFYFNESLSLLNFSNREIRNALDYFGFDPNKELPIVTKIRTDVKKLNDKNVIIQKIKEMEKDINFKMDKDRFIWNEEEEEKQRKKSSRTKSGKKKSLTKKQEQKPPEIFEPKQVIVSQNAKNSLDQISKYLEDTTKNSKMARSVNNSRTDKSKSKPAHFLSKLVSTSSDDRNLVTGSLRSFSGELNSNTFNEFLNANKKSNRTSSDDGYEDNDDAKSEESDNYFEQYAKAPGASAAEQINPNRSISYQTTVATISSQRIDTILEEAD